MFPWRKRPVKAGDVRPAAVAGKFYPAAPSELRRHVHQLLSGVTAQIEGSPASLKALIVPHAGYIYSGPIAASAYARLLAERRPAITRVVMLGPAHRSRVAGLAGCQAQAFATPLGLVPVDQQALSELADLPYVELRDDAHRDEHCLEVQLPFLQLALEGRPSSGIDAVPFSIVPLLVGRATTEQVREVLERLWGGEETLIVVTSDLSHYHDYETARQFDAATAAAIAGMHPGDLGEQSACGRIPIRGLMLAARDHGLHSELLDLRSSGDIGGDRQRVVGYGAFAFVASQHAAT